MGGGIGVPTIILYCILITKLVVVLEVFVTRPAPCFVTVCARGKAIDLSSVCCHRCYRRHENRQISHSRHLCML